MHDLRDAMARFDAATQGRIVHIGLEWPAFQIAQGSRMALQQQSDAVILPEVARAYLFKTFVLMTQIGNYPVSPSELDIEFRDAIEQGVDDLPPGMQVGARGFLAAFLSLGPTHPAADLGLLLGSRLPKVELSGKRVGLLVAPDVREAVQRSVRVPDGVDLQFLTSTELKRSAMLDVVFVFGSPERRLWSGTPLSERRRIVSWLYSSPAAPLTIHVSWADSFDLSDYGIWAEQPLLASESVGPSRFRVVLEDHPDESTQLALLGDVDGIPASNVGLVGGGSVAFANEIGPWPQVIDEEELELQVKKTRVGKVEVNDVLVLRPESSEIELIRAEARKSMGARAYDQALDRSRRFKELVKAQARLSDAEERLRNVGIVNPSYYLHVVEIDRYIGPESQSKMRSIAVALGISFDPEDFSAIHQLQIQHRRAGMVFSKRISEWLLANHEWREHVQLGLQVHIHVPDAGPVRLAIVGSKTADKVRISRLGLAIGLPETSSGRVVEV